MKKISLIIFTLMFSLIALSQTKIEVYFGEPGRNDGCSDLLEMYDKGYYLTGGIDGTNGNSNGWNIKTDINLQLLYDKVLENVSNSVGAITSVSDEQGNIYVAGFVWLDNEWPFISKIDSCGNEVWCKILDYSFEMYDYGWVDDILIADNGDIVLLTYLDSDPEIETIFLIGMSPDGDVLWKKGYASKDNYPWIDEASGYNIAKINNEYYISGFCYWPYPNDTTHFYLRPLFIGISNSFKEKWILPFAALDSVYGDAYNTIAINDSVFMGVGIRRLDNNVDNSLLMFYNKDGEELGYNEIHNEQIGPDINSNEIRNIQRINDSLFITTSPFGPDYSENPLGEMVIDTVGNIYFIKSHPNTTAFIPGLIKTYDSNYVIATNIKESNPAKTDIYVYKIDENLNDVPFDSTYHNYDSLCPGGIQSGTIDLSDCFVWTNIGDAPTPQEYYASLKQIPVKAYPNPVTGNKITFEYENTEHHRNIQLNCFNIYGEEVHKEKIYRNQGASIVNVSGWQKGMYFAVVYSNGKVVGKCKFVVR